MGVFPDLPIFPVFWDLFNFTKKLQDDQWHLCVSTLGDGLIAFHRGGRRVQADEIASGSTGLKWHGHCESDCGTWGNAKNLRRLGTFHWFFDCVSLQFTGHWKSCCALLKDPKGIVGPGRSGHITPEGPNIDHSKGFHHFSHSPSVMALN